MTKRGNSYQPGRTRRTGVVSLERNDQRFKSGNGDVSGGAGEGGGGEGGGGGGGLDLVSRISLCIGRLRDVEAFY